MRGIASVVVVMGMMLIVHPAVGDDKEKAISHFQNGISLMEVEDFAGAVVEFEASVALYPSKSALFNLGMCHKATHSYVQSLATFRRLKADFSATLDEETQAEVDKNIESLQRLLAEVEVSTSRPGATVYLEGEPVGTTPLVSALVVKVGQHRIKVTLDGFKTQEKLVSVTGGAHQVVNFELESDAPPPPVLPAVVATPLVTQPTITPQPVQEPPPQQGSKSELAMETVELPKEMDRIFKVYGGGVGMQSIAGVVVIGISIPVGITQGFNDFYSNTFPLVFGLAHVGASFMGGAIAWSIGNKSKHYDVPFWAPLVGAIVGNAASFGLGMAAWHGSNELLQDNPGMDADELLAEKGVPMILGFFVGPLLLPPVFEALFYGLFRKPEARYSTNAVGHPQPWRLKLMPPSGGMMMSMDGTGRSMPSITVLSGRF